MRGPSSDPFISTEDQDTRISFFKIDLLAWVELPEIEQILSLKHNNSTRVKPILLIILDNIDYIRTQCEYWAMNIEN